MKELSTEYRQKVRETLEETHEEIKKNTVGPEPKIAGYFEGEPLFGGEGWKEYQSLYDALHKCAEDEGKGVYEFLSETPRTSLVVELVDKLHKMGWHIRPAKPDSP